MKIGTSPSEFAREQTNVNKNSKIPTHETAKKAKEEIDNQRIEEKKSNSSFIKGLVSTSFGLATLIGDVVLLPPSSGASVCSVAIGGALVGTGISIMLSN